MKVYRDVDFYALKPEIAGKQPPKKLRKTRKKQQITENQKSTCGECMITLLDMVDCCWRFITTMVL